MRAEGYYWVKRHDTRDAFTTAEYAWEVARYEHFSEGGAWMLCGWNEPYTFEDEGLAHIDERPLVYRAAPHLRALPLDA